MSHRFAPCLLAALVFLLVGCRGDGGNGCTVPDGCLVAGAGKRADGTCDCQTWQIADAVSVPIRYVVLNVSYELDGSKSAAWYGYSGQDWPGVPSSAWGSRWRTVVEGMGNSSVARILPTDFPASLLARVTADSVTFGLGHGAGGFRAGRGMPFWGMDLQYGVVADFPICVTQHPTLGLATTTPECTMEIRAYVDTVYGTILTLPTSIAAACTTP
jgi:hypothetical protein